MGFVSAIVNFIAVFALVSTLAQDGGDMVVIVLSTLAIAVANYVHGLED